MDVGVVTIDYLERPRGPVHDFLASLSLDPTLGDCDDEYEAEDDFDGEDYVWSLNAIVEFSRQYLDWRVDRWVTSRNIYATTKSELRHWIDNLPWKNDYIMLHIGS